MSKEEHITESGMLLTIMPWCEKFHTHLLRQLQDASRVFDPEKMKQADEIERLNEEIQSLNDEIKKLISAASEKEQNGQKETLERHQREYERLKREIDTLKDLRAVSLRAPAYQLRLLTDFADQWEGCKVLIAEQRDEALFYGTEEDCGKGKTALLKLLQVKMIMMNQ